MAMIALSTAWNSKINENGRDIISQILDVGFMAIELDCSISEKKAKDIKPVIGIDIQATSVQNFCPFPSIYPISMAGIDAFLLSSPDKEQRELAIKYTIRTIEFADSIDARNVICHFGYVDIEDPTQKLIELAKKDMRESDEFEALIEKTEANRNSKISRYIDAMFFSLDKIIRRADELDVAICIENRGDLRQIPNFDEIGLIFNEFRGANIAYWHDIENAKRLSEIGLTQYMDLPEKFSANMNGIRLSITKPEPDKEPNISDFTSIKKHISEKTIIVIQANSKITIDELREILQFLS